MGQTCSKCFRVNPTEARYCYYDGSALDEVVHGGSPPSGSGGQCFPTPFLFSPKRSCGSFDELALACQENWQTAQELLRQGSVEDFLKKIGRDDLAAAAREAARFPDHDRGLDRLLAQFPSNALEAPKLQVRPQDVHLGVLQVGSDERFDLRLENQGMRLLSGSVTCDDCFWLSLGDAPDVSEKFFHCSCDLTIPVRVRGSRLRAGRKPLLGRIVIESNGGSATVLVRAEVPVRPFPTGALAGARSPRQLAVKAKARPTEAAGLFDNGAVKQWYSDNGWTYPVQGPPASGLGAVQQFFEALGLTLPPRVEISDSFVTLHGVVGRSCEHVIEIKTREKKPVYAYATSNQPWLAIGPLQFRGRKVSIPLLVPMAPDQKGETLTAVVVVVANGRQQFTVPVALAVECEPQSTPLQVPVETLPSAHALAATAFGEDEVAPPLAPAVPETFPLVSAEKSRRRLWIHLLPAGALLLVLLAVLLWDVVQGNEHRNRDPEVRSGIRLDEQKPFALPNRLK